MSGIQESLGTSQIIFESPCKNNFMIDNNEDH